MSKMLQRSSTDMVVMTARTATTCATRVSREVGHVCLGDEDGQNPHYSGAAPWDDRDVLAWRLAKTREARLVNACRSMSLCDRQAALLHVVHLGRNTNRKFSNVWWSGGCRSLWSGDVPFRPKPIRTISGGFGIVFKVQPHATRLYMCMCCSLFVPTQFHFEYCGVLGDSR